MRQKLRQKLVRQKLAIWRWRLVGLAIAVIVIRVIASLAFGVIESESALFAGLVAVLGIVFIVLAVLAIVGFVWYGRIYNARVPTE